MTVDTVDQTIQLCEQLDVLLCLICEAAIKPEVDKVEHHYRNCHKTVVEQLQAVIAFAASFSSSGWRPRTLHDPADENIQLPPDGSAPIPGLRTYKGFSCRAGGCRFLTRNKSNFSTHESRNRHRTQVEGKRGREPISTGWLTVPAVCASIWKPSPITLASCSYKYGISNNTSRSVNVLL